MKNFTPMNSQYLEVPFLQSIQKLKKFARSSIHRNKENS